MKKFCKNFMRTLRISSKICGKIRKIVTNNAAPRAGVSDKFQLNFVEILRKL